MSKNNIKYMWKIFTFLQIVIISSCSTSYIKIEDRKEGIISGKLRIYIRSDYPASSMDDEKFESFLKKRLNKISRDRAIHLILTYIRVATKDPAKYHLFDNDILRSVEKGKVIFQKCFEEYCESFIDYKVDELIKKIDKYKKSDDKAGS